MLEKGRKDTTVVVEVVVEDREEKSPISERSVRKRTRQGKETVLIRFARLSLFYNVEVKKVATKISYPDFFFAARYEKSKVHKQ